MFQLKKAQFDNLPLLHRPNWVAAIEFYYKSYTFLVATAHVRVVLVGCQVRSGFVRRVSSRLRVSRLSPSTLIATIAETVKSCAVKGVWNRVKYTSSRRRVVRGSGADVWESETGCDADAGWRPLDHAENLGNEMDCLVKLMARQNLRMLRAKRRPVQNITTWQ